MNGQEQEKRRSSIEACSAALPRFAWPVGTGLTALTIFVLSLAPTVTAEDSGELIAAAWCFGIPHPPGYPLWTMLCGLFTHAIPIGSVALRANLFSAVCGAGTAVVVHAAIRELGISRPVAAASSLIWVWSRWAWSQSVITEVYGLNSLLAAVILWCAIRWYMIRSSTPLMVASLVLGLGMSNHHSIALAGLALVAWILTLQPRLLRRWRLVLAGIGCFLIGLLPYLYLPFRANTHPPVNWGNPSTPQRFWAHVTRHQYGAVGPMKVAESRSLSRLARQIGYVGESVCDDLTPWLAGVAVLGLAFLAWRHRPLLWLVLLWLAGTGALFALLANYDLDRTSRWVMRVFLIPVSLGLMIPIAFLLDGVLSGVRKSFGQRRWLANAVAFILVAAGPTTQVVAHRTQCNYADYWYAYDHAENLLRCMLPGALVFTSGDHDTFPLLYLLTVEDRRADVLIANTYGYIDPKLLRDKPSDARDSSEAWLIKQMKRPVYYTVKKPPALPDLRVVPAGLLYRLVPKRLTLDGPDLLARCDYRNLVHPGILDYGANQILISYEFFSGLGDLDGGQTGSALSHFERAAAYGKGLKKVLNNIGSALAEHGLDTQAIEYFEEASDLDWRYALPRWNLFRVMKRKEQWQGARKWLDEVIKAAPDDFRAYGEMGFLLRAHLDDPQGAIRCWQESLRRNPAQPQIVRALAQSY